MKIRILSLAILAVSILGSTASAQLTNFFEDFKGLDRTSSNALADAGWNGAAAGITPRVVGSNFSLILVHPTTLIPLSFQLSATVPPAPPPRWQSRIGCLQRLQQ